MDSREQPTVQGEQQPDIREQPTLTAAQPAEQASVTPKPKKTGRWTKEAKEKRATLNAARQRSVQSQVLQESKEEQEELALRCNEEAKRVMGRPSTYTEEQEVSLLGHMTSGGSLVRWCQANGVSPVTVYGWMARRPDFAMRYAQARADRVETHVEQLLDIADSTEGLSRDEVESAKLRIETRKWIAAKLKPAAYGDRLAPQGREQVTINIDLGQAVAAVGHTQPVTIEASSTSGQGQQADSPSGERVQALPVRAEWAGD